MARPAHCERRSAGFTLVELLVVIAIIAILMALLIPAVQKVRDSAARVRCHNNLHQIALAAHSYEAANKRFPSGLNYPGATNFATAPEPNKYYGLHVALMPYLERGDIVKAIDFTSEYKNNTNGATSVGATPVPTLVCPADPSIPIPPTDTYTSGGTTYTFGITSYGGCSGTSATKTDGSLMLKDGIFYTNSRTRIREITDGTSNTFFFGERSRVKLTEASNAMAVGGWAWANRNALLDHTMNTSSGTMRGVETHDLNDFGSTHGGGIGALFAFADGSVRFIQKAINFQAYQRVSTRAGGEVVDISSFE